MSLSVKDIALSAKALNIRFARAYAVHQAVKGSAAVRPATGERVMIVAVVTTCALRGRIA
jgi:hypothetical protein